MSSDSGMAGISKPVIPYLERTEQTVRTCLEIGLVPKLLAELKRKAVLDTAVLVRATKAMRQMLGKISFAELKPWSVALVLHHALADFL